MSVNNLDNILWTEKYRPKNLAELIVPQRIKKIFDGGVVQSMLLHGTAGIGKTSAAKAICKQFNHNVLYLNCSDTNGVDTIRDTIIDKLPKKIVTPVIEETVADVFITLWNNADKVQEGKLKGYICCIARTRTLNKIAVNRNKAVLNIDDYDPEDDFFIADETEKKDIHRELREIIKEIELPDREILIRYYYYYQTVSQISEAMEMNIEMVKSKLRRTRNKIKAKLIERSYTL